MTEKLTLLVRMIDIQHGQVVAVNVSKAHLRFVGLLLGIVGPHEALWYCVHSQR